MRVQTGCKGKEMMQNKTYIEKKQQVKLEKSEIEQRGILISKPEK